MFNDRKHWWNMLQLVAKLEKLKLKDAAENWKYTGKNRKKLHQTLEPLRFR